MDFRLAPNVNTVLMSSFLNSSQSLGPRTDDFFSVLGVALIFAFWFIDVS